MSLLRNETDADEAFSMFCADLWAGLPAFRGHASYRTWSYQIARRAAFRLPRGDSRRQKRFELDDGTVAAQLANEIRTTTAAFRRTDVKDRMRALREQLKPDEREL